MNLYQEIYQICCEHGILKNESLHSASWFWTQGKKHKEEDLEYAVKIADSIGDVADYPTVIMVNGPVTMVKLFGSVSGKIEFTLTRGSNFLYKYNADGALQSLSVYLNFDDNVEPASEYKISIQENVVMINHNGSGNRSMTMKDINIFHWCAPIGKKVLEYLAENNPDSIWVDIANHYDPSMLNDCVSDICNVTYHQRAMLPSISFDLISKTSSKEELFQKMFNRTLPQEIEPELLSVQFLYSLGKCLSYMNEISESEAFALIYDDQDKANEVFNKRLRRISSNNPPKQVGTLNSIRNIWIITMFSTLIQLKGEYVDESEMEYFLNLHREAKEKIVEIPTCRMDFKIRIKELIEKISNKFSAETKSNYQLEKLGLEKNFTIIDSPKKLKTWILTNRLTDDDFNTVSKHRGIYISGDMVGEHAIYNIVKKNDHYKIVKAYFTHYRRITHGSSFIIKKYTSDLSRNGQMISLLIKAFKEADQWLEVPEKIIDPFDSGFRLKE